MFNLVTYTTTTTRLYTQTTLKKSPSAPSSTPLYTNMRITLEEQVLFIVVIKDIPGLLPLLGESYGLKAETLDLCLVPDGFLLFLDLLEAVELLALQLVQLSHNVCQRALVPRDDDWGVEG